MESYVLNIKDKFVELCKSLAGPATLYAFGVIIFNEVTRIGEIKELSTNIKFSVLVDSVVGALFFATVMIIMSVVWFAVVFFDWIYPIYTKGIDDADNDNAPTSFIKCLVLPVTTLIFCFGFIWFVWATGNIIFIR